MAEADTRMILCIPDDHRDKIIELLENEMNKPNGYIHLTDKNGVTMKFYRNGERLFADRKDGDKEIIQPVITMSEAAKIQEAQRPLKDRFAERIQSDCPDKPKEEVEQEAEVLSQANESIRRLVAAGMEPSIAKKVITAVLECEHPPSTAEELAELISKLEKDQKAD